MSKPGYLNYRVDPDDMSRLAALAQEKGYSVSELARKCLRAGLKLAPDFPTKTTDHEVRARVAA